MSPVPSTAHLSLWSSPKPKSSSYCFYQMCSDPRGFEKRGKGRGKDGKVKGKDKKKQYQDGAFYGRVCSSYVKLVHIKSSALSCLQFSGTWVTRFLNFHSSFSFLTVRHFRSSEQQHFELLAGGTSTTLCFAHHPSAGRGLLLLWWLWRILTPAWGAAMKPRCFWTLWWIN